MRLRVSRRKPSPSCRTRRSPATCGRKSKITTAGSRAWRRSRRRCGKNMGSELNHERLNSSCPALCRASTSLGGKQERRGWGGGGRPRREKGREAGGEERGHGGGW